MNERGLAESTQWAVLAPTLLGLVLGLVQLGVWLHSRTIAASAAAAVADVRALGASQDAAAREVGRRVAIAGGLQDVDIQLSTGADMVLVTVDGRVLYTAGLADCFDQTEGSGYDYQLLAA